MILSLHEHTAANAPKLALCDTKCIQQDKVYAHVLNLG